MQYSTGTNIAVDIYFQTAPQFVQDNGPTTATTLTMCTYSSFHDIIKI